MSYRFITIWTAIIFCAGSWVVGLWALSKLIHYVMGG